MTFLQAMEKLTQLRKEVEALQHAYNILWDDFDTRRMAIAIENVLTRTKEERDKLENYFAGMEIDL